MWPDTEGLCQARFRKASDINENHSVEQVMPSAPENAHEVSAPAVTQSQTKATSAGAKQTGGSNAFRASCEVGT